MKKLLFAVAVCVSMMAFSQDAAADKKLAANAKLCAMSVEEFKALAPAEQKARIKKARAENANKMMAKRAKLCGMPVEEFKALKPAERNAKIKAAKKAAKAKKSVE